jgi:hypothetical protein
MIAIASDQRKTMGTAILGELAGNGPPTGIQIKISPGHLDHLAAALPAGLTADSAASRLGALCREVFTAAKE